MIPDQVPEFADGLAAPTPLRAQITAAYRRPEHEALPALLEQARMGAPTTDAANALALRIAQQLRTRKSATGRAGRS